jgi:anti-sigma regulatory factor (Ser/Thr protein kinase)
VASAGHLPPLIVNDGAAVTLDVPVGLPLGIGGMPYETTEFKVADDSLLVMFTDGLVAGGTHPDAEAGTAELCQNLTSASVTSPGTARDVIVAWHANNPAPDDAVVLVAQAHGVANDHVASRPVSPDPADVAAVRAWTLGCLAAWELDELSFVVELIVSELATNAIRYGRQPAVLRLLRDRDRALICEVSDSGHTSPHLRRAGPDDEGGRGLFLVAQLTDHWGTRYTRDGKTIWTELPTASG